MLSIRRLAMRIHESINAKYLLYNGSGIPLLFLILSNDSMLILI